MFQIAPNSNSEIPARSAMQTGHIFEIWNAKECENEAL